MANDLTGDYDVVAAFSLGAVDRILAAMHRGNRLPHSLSMAVSDFPSLNLGSSAVSVVDRLGNAIRDASRVKRAASAVTAPASLRSEEVLNNVDPVVNWRPDPTVPSGPREIRLGGPGIPGGIIGATGPYGQMVARFNSRSYEFDRVMPLADTLTAGRKRSTTLDCGDVAPAAGGTGQAVQRAVSPAWRAGTATDNEC